MKGLASAGAFAATIALTAAVLLFAPVGGGAIAPEVRSVDAAVALVAGAFAIGCLVLLRRPRHGRRRAR